MDQAARMYFNDKYKRYKNICNNRGQKKISFKEFTKMTFLAQDKLIKQMRRSKCHI